MRVQSIPGHHSVGPEIEATHTHVYSIALISVSIYHINVYVQYLISGGRRS